MHIKQYIHYNNPSPKEGDLTIIGGHGNGFTKELYEPFWENLLRVLEEKGVRVMAIWVADIANMRQSGKLNESYFGVFGASLPDSHLGD